eukprot:15455287-Alexandrium_andersonii.AAC.1
MSSRERQNGSQSGSAAFATSAQRTALCRLGPAEAHALTAPWSPRVASARMSGVCRDADS